MTTITSAQANKILQAALFTQTTRANSFLNMLTDTAPAPTSATGQTVGGRTQTPYGAPVVRVTDLNKEKGDEVDMQIVFNLSNRPTMGDKKIEGRGEDMSFGSFALKINQYRHNVDAGGKMSQQRFKHDLRATAKALLGTYVNRLQDQIATIHLAGARGDFMAPDTIVPLASHSEFADIMVNPVRPPTYDRHFFAGDATSVETIDASDTFTLQSVDDMALRLSEMSNPIMPIRYSGEGVVNMDPFHILFITPRQWHDFWQSTSGKEWQQIAAEAIERSKGLNHPAFGGLKKAFWNGILVTTYPGMPIRFNQGSTVTVSTNTDSAATAQVTAATTIDRAILVGAQALASAYGNTGAGQFFGYHEEKTDHENSSETSVRWIQGISKVRFGNQAGRVNDYGVMVLDSAVSTGGLSSAN